MARTAALRAFPGDMSNDDQARQQRRRSPPGGGVAKWLRTLLIHGARAMLARAKAPSAWQLKLTKRRPLNCRRRGDGQQDSTHDLGWALLAHDREYRLSTSRDGHTNLELREESSGIVCGSSGDGCNG